VKQKKGAEKIVGRKERRTMSTMVRSIAPVFGARSFTALPVAATVPEMRAGLAVTAALTPAGGAGWQ